MYFLVGKGVYNDDVGVARAAIFQEIRPEAGLKTGGFVKEMLGGLPWEDYRSRYYETIKFKRPRFKLQIKRRYELHPGTQTASRRTPHTLYFYPSSDTPHSSALRWNVCASAVRSCPCRAFGTTHTTHTTHKKHICGYHVPEPTRLGKMSKPLQPSRHRFWKDCLGNTGDCHV